MITEIIEWGGGGNLLCGSTCERRVKPFGLLYSTNANPFGNISIIKYDNVEGKKYLASFLTTNKVCGYLFFSFQTCGGSEKNKKREVALRREIELG